MAPVNPASPSAGVLFRDVTWADHEAQLRIVGERPIRVTYDRGRMEVYTSSLGHEDDAYPTCWAGSSTPDRRTRHRRQGRKDRTTQKRRDLDQAPSPTSATGSAEPQRMAGKRQLDLAIDPPPDLAIEVDITHNSIDRLPMFAVLGIPEIWRQASGSIQFLHLQPDGPYQPRDPSLAFPTLSAAELAGFDRG